MTFFLVATVIGGILAGVLWGIALGYRSCAKRILASNDIGDAESSYWDALKDPKDLHVHVQKNLSRSQIERVMKK